MLYRFFALGISHLASCSAEFRSLRSCGSIDSLFVACSCSCRVNGIERVKTEKASVSTVDAVLLLCFIQGKWTVSKFQTSLTVDPRSSQDKKSRTLSTLGNTFFICTHTRILLYFLRSSFNLTCSDTSNLSLMFLTLLMKEAILCLK